MHRRPLRGSSALPFVRKAGDRITLQQFLQVGDGNSPATPPPATEAAARGNPGVSWTEPTAAEAAELTSVAEVGLPEATSGMEEDTAIEACTWAAAPQPARFFLPFLRGGTSPPAVSRVGGSLGG